VVSQYGGDRGGEEPLGIVCLQDRVERSAHGKLLRSCSWIGPARSRSDMELLWQAADERVHFPQYVRLVRTEHKVTRMRQSHNVGAGHSFFERVGLCSCSRGCIVGVIRSRDSTRIVSGGRRRFVRGGEYGQYGDWDSCVPLHARCDVLSD
jgi:hypothetical protein